MLVMSAHKRAGHLRGHSTLSLLRTDMGYWPIGGITTVKFYLKDCFRCRLIGGSRGKQVMSSLPPERIRPFGAVFLNVSVDYAGPFTVTMGRRSLKRWMCVCVCMATTAVRIEVVFSLSTESFLKAFRRFLSSTGHVTQKIRSDNATCFVGARNDIEKVLNDLDKHIQETGWMQKRNIQWEFGPPEASHHYGLHERQIRTIRKIMLGLPDLSHTNPNDEDLLTLFKEAEYMMNLRPLVKSEDPCSLPPLTPISLMTGYYAESPIPVRPSQEGDVIRRGYKFTQRIADLWWNRWIREYVPLLQARQKWLKEEPNFKKGDLILLADEASPRNQYPYAVITETKLDRDGRVRTVVARKADGVYRTRDIRKIALVDGAPQ